MLNTFVVYVEDKPGVLARVAILFRRRAFNIETLTVGRTEVPGVSRMTIVVDTDEHGALRIEANLYKLVNILRIQNITESYVSRDMALIKVAISAETKARVHEIIGKHGAQIVEAGSEALILQFTGTKEKIDEFVEILRPYRILEMVCTGHVAMAGCSSLASQNTISSFNDSVTGNTQNIARSV
ncbi:MAG TPA: acetolactate synthase small subunit [Terriglobales bacterium]|nr:acetolactate synthase small subunit [Terriglobales bacterium]